MNIALFEDHGVEGLYPLTWVRAPFELRCGRDLLIDKIRAHVGRGIVRLWLRPWIHTVVSDRLRLEEPNAAQDWCLLNARAMVTGDVEPPRPGVVWRHNGDVVAAGVRAADLPGLTAEFFQQRDAVDEWAAHFRTEELPENVRLLHYPWELSLWNQVELERQLAAVGEIGRRGLIYPGAHLIQPEQICVQPGAKVKPGVVLDAEEGPIYIDRDALIQPNAVLEGPCCVGVGTIIRPGSLIRPGTSIGPVCKVGGEVEASIIQGHTNKQHDGFIGHSFVAEWVNLGADTITSDLKNTYGTIRVNINGVGVESGQHFIGSIIGDHAKTGIGTMLPTGGVIGVAANVFAQQAVPKFVPSFAWLTDSGMTPCRVEKVLDIARIVMERRDVALSDPEAQLLRKTAELARQIEAAGWNGNHKSA